MTEAPRKALSILHVDSASTFRGGQQALLTLAQGLRERGHSQTIATPMGSALARRAEPLGFPVIPLSLGSLRKAARSAGILHTHSGRAQNLGWAASIGIPVARVSTRHVAFEPRGAILHRLKYRHTCDAVIAVSGAVQRVLVHAGIPAERITVVPTGIILPPNAVTNAGRARAREAWGLAPDDFVVGHLGAFTHEKGQDVALEAAQILALRAPNLKLILAGTGPNRTDLERRKGEAPVLFPGYVEDHSQWFSLLDLFLMPSRSEAWGLAALEAMAHGIPVAASRVGGLPEIVEPGVSGWLVPPEDAAALADTIAEAYADRAHLQELARNARVRAGLFSAAKTAALTEEVYLRLLR